MSITLDLPHELESKLSAEATRLGLSLSEYVVHVLSEGRPAEQRLKTGDELVAYWQREGVIGSRPDIFDSQKRARRIRQKAERRTRSR
jgi:hypothetical protein